MHRIIQENLEEILAGTLAGKMRETLEAHMAGCGECREEVHAMREMSSLLQVFRTEEMAAPPPGFYGRVVRRIDDRQESSLWMLLFQPAFARRVAFASLLLLATLGGFLASREAEMASSPTAEMVLAAEEERPARDQMLMTLVRYDE